MISLEPKRSAGEEIPRTYGESEPRGEAPQARSRRRTGTGDGPDPPHLLTSPPHPPETPITSPKLTSPHPYLTSPTDLTPPTDLTTSTYLTHILTSPPHHPGTYLTSPPLPHLPYGDIPLPLSPHLLSSPLTSDLFTSQSNGAFRPLPLDPTDRSRCVSTSPTPPPRFTSPRPDLPRPDLPRPDLPRPDLPRLHPPTPFTYLPVDCPHLLSADFLNLPQLTQCMTSSK